MGAVSIQEEVSHMSSPYFRIIKGTFIIIGKEPDGDSVRFVADNPELYRALRNAFRIKPTQSDGSVQLRFEAVDAPELHYGTDAQPMGDTARDQLLRWMSFGNIQFSAASPTQVIAANPATVRGAILT